MRIEIEHTTTYRYTTPASAVVERLRLTAPACSWQTVESWEIDAPGIARACTYDDAFGNRVDLITPHGEAEEIAITARGVVETDGTSHAVTGVAANTPPALFHRFTAFTEPDDALRALAAELNGKDTLSNMHALMTMVAERVPYEVGETEAATTAAEALAHGYGVCQDHAHIMICVARLLGVPARYVTGYLVMDDGQVAEAHHAWAEVEIPGLGWTGFDVSNQQSPTERYVRLSTGLDHASAAPVRGTHRGGGEETLDVRVAVQQQQ